MDKLRNKTSRTHKDGVFRMLFKEKQNLLELYNALEGTDYGPDTKVEIKTIEVIIFKNLKNDIAFIIDGRFIVFMEHQSSINENMPLRMIH